MDFESFFNDIMPQVPGADQDLITQVLGNVIRDFLVKTELITKRITPISTSVGTIKYNISLGSALYEPVRVKDAWYKKVKMRPTTLDALQDLLSDFKQYSQGTPTYFYQEDYKSISVFPPPDTAVTDAITADVVVTVKHEPPTIPDDLVPYRDILTVGTIGRLLVSNNPAVANPQLGAVYMNEYTARSADVRYRRSRSYSAPLRVTPRKWL